MLEDLSVETFRPLVGEPFLAGQPTGPLELTLVEASSTGEGPGVEVAGRPLRAPFSLIFAGPMRPILPQHTYAIQHRVLGTLELFIVPIGPEGGQMRYQAVFG